VADSDYTFICDLRSHVARPCDQGGQSEAPITGACTVEGFWSFMKWLNIESASEKVKDKGYKISQLLVPDVSLHANGLSCTWNMMRTFITCSSTCDMILRSFGYQAVFMTDSSVQFSWVSINVVPSASTSGSRHSN